MGRQVEIACDESGFTGGSLVGSQTVFAHAGVRVGRSAAEELVAHLRERLDVRVGELKAARLLRPRHRPTVEWLLGPASPVAGEVRIHLTDTAFYVLARLTDLATGHAVRGTDSPGRDARARAMAMTLHEEGPHTYGADRWRTFLTLSANLLRTHNRWLPKAPVEAYFAFVAALLDDVGTGAVADVLRVVERSRDVAAEVRARHERDRKLTPLMEPVVPALARTVEWWLTDAEEVVVVHDEQSALTPQRLRDVAATVARRRPGRRLTGVSLVDSKVDARVQVADLFAGVARRLAGDRLAGRADGDLTALLRPRVHPESTWPAAAHELVAPF
jgi:hypothetical protein